MNLLLQITIDQQLFQILALVRVLGKLDGLPDFESL